MIFDSEYSLNRGYGTGMFGSGTEGADGFGWRISTAFDFGRGNNGFLLGLTYHGSVKNVFAHFGIDDVPSFRIVSTNVGIFAKYVYRRDTRQNARAGNVERENQRAARRQAPASRPTEPAPIETVSTEDGLEGAIARASAELIDSLPENTRLAVLNISSNDGNVSSHVVDELEFYLVSSRRFTIVDRNTLDAIRLEQNFQMAGEVSDSSAVSIGQVLGANIVITGSITEIGRNQRLSIRALDVRTAEILAMVRVTY